ncbi:NAD(P)/FAD-dependent oxidoreductase [Mycobacterium sp. DBP42]|uniref:NAD(P)/FAD-dependent oxidoreductase n=1 Tax=Mycobacterium sp. DBP42 TaxID=2545267 RepID=UPI00110CC0DB|nr:FAD/NAD(P)-binding oxidoreductase [Mycobacterium sp. DBP42]TMS52431.1 NAD(P)/FAD-dependent oxidoreductase [Mycobacterium sp. DBP42]
MAETVVIVGSSNGGVASAQALRRSGYAGRIILLGEETDWPYDKPPLSKEFLAGTATADDISLITEAEADELGIELRLGCRAASADLAHNVIELESGEKVGFDYLIIATGARARPSPWGRPAGVELLRSLDDSQRLQSALERGGSLVVIGGGFIGSEVAATARLSGLEVTIVDPLPTLMDRALGPVVGDRFVELHQRHGVSMYLGTGVQQLTREDGRLKIELTDGETLSADSVVVGIGAIPNDDWLASSGLLVDNGVVCDEYGRAVQQSNVFAVGDVACWHHPRHGQPCRVEHWTNATDQANVVAHNIAHPEELMSHAPVEYVWSDQYDWKLRIAGQTGSATKVELVEADQSAGRFAALYSADGSALSGLAVVNWPRALVAGRKALQGGTSYDEFKQTLEGLAAGQPKPAEGARI